MIIIFLKIATLLSSNVLLTRLVAAGTSLDSNQCSTVDNVIGDPKITFSSALCLLSTKGQNETDCIVMFCYCLSKICKKYNS